MSSLGMQQMSDKTYTQKEMDVAKEAHKDDVETLQNEIQKLNWWIAKSLGKA